MPGDREKLSGAQEAFVRILTDAISEDLFSDLSDGPWIAVRCNNESEQKALADRFGAQGLEVILRSRTA